MRPLCPFLFTLFVILSLQLVGCGGDWGAGGSEYDDIFRARLRFYYMEECDYDAFGPYNCLDAVALRSPMRVSVRIEYDGYATVDLDGEVYRYDSREYTHGFDDLYGDYYYQFHEADGDLTIYEDGYRMIYVDNWARKGYYYYQDLLIY